LTLPNFLKPNGKITFAGEPINSWWKSWGMRLDFLSVYCIRKFGWFENGWTKEFISECFNRVGFNLTLLPHIGLRNGIIGVATHSENREVEISSDAVIPKFIWDHAVLEESHHALHQSYHNLLNSRWMKLRRVLNFKFLKRRLR